METDNGQPSADIDNLQNIEMLICELYLCGSNTYANKQLSAFQSSKECWDLCWLLLSPEKSLEVQHFGASCIHHKISRFWPEIDVHDEFKQILRTKLMDTLCRYVVDSNLRIVQTKLCVALAAFIINTIRNFWPTAIQDLIENLQPTKLPHITPQKVIGLLVEVLTVIPEEIKTFTLSAHDKGIVCHAFLQSANQVMSVLKSILEQNSGTPCSINGSECVPTCLKFNTIKCWSNWSQGFNALHFGELHEPILDLVLAEIGNDELVVCCVESIVTIYCELYAIESYPSYTLRLIDKIVRLEPVLSKALKEKSMFLAGTIYSLFINIGEAHSRLLLETVLNSPERRDSIMKLLSLILQCSATEGYYPIDETCSEQAFNFWYTFQDYIIASVNMVTYASLFNPLYQSLIDALLIKVQYPPDEVYAVEWTSEDKESFRCYRQDIGDCLMYCYNILRLSMLASLMTHFQAALAHMNSYISASSPVPAVAGVGSSTSATCSSDKPWQYLEAVIFAFNSIAENVPFQENVYVNQLFDSLKLIPFDQVKSPRLVAIVMEMFGSYCEWIYNHPGYLPSILSLLLMGLKSDHIAVVTATMALKDITRECQILIEPYAYQLLTSCEQGLRDDSHLKPKEKSRLMCIVGQVLTMMPHDCIMEWLKIILPPILFKLDSGLKAETDNNESVVKSVVVANLNMLTMLFATLDPSQKPSPDQEENDGIKLKVPSHQQQNTKIDNPPCLAVFKEVLPLLIGIANKWPNDEDTIEALAECFKKSIKNLQDHAKPLVMDIIGMIYNIYGKVYQHHLLEILKQVIAMFDDDPTLQPYLFSCYGQICDRTIAKCQNVMGEAVLLEFFFGVAFFLLREIPDLHKCPEVNNLLLYRLAIATLVLPEKAAVKSASCFISEAIRKSKDLDVLNSVVISEGEYLVGQVFTILGGASPKPNAMYMSDILIALNRQHSDYLYRWLTPYVQKRGFPVEQITQQQKEIFAKSILREKKNKSKVKEIVSEFIVLCRSFQRNPFPKEDNVMQH